MHGADITELTLEEISKIEGKASLHVRMDGDTIDVQFAITELKRFYTTALQGKDVMAVPQLTARICGTCSNAHLLCAIKAIEEAHSITVTNQTVLLRQLVNYGLMIRDHTLHLMVFCLPDILGIDSLLDLDEHDPIQHQFLDDTFQIKAAGNNLTKAIGGRSVHAPFLTIGGFIKLPDPTQFPVLVKELQDARSAVLRMIDTFLHRDMDLQKPIMFSALADDSYTFLSGRIKDTNNVMVDAETYRQRLEHTVIPYSHASGYTDAGSIYMVGALARMNLSRDTLHADTKRAASEAIGKFPSVNVFHNDLAQAIEVLHSIDASLEILKTLTIQDEKPQLLCRHAVAATASIEAPRGTLIYRLGFDEFGKTTDVSIVVPTGQNQIGIEQAIQKYISEHRHDTKESLSLACERIIRAYDPCMSCASHFLKITWE